MREKTQIKSWFIYIAFTIFGIILGAAGAGIVLSQKSSAIQEAAEKSLQESLAEGSKNPSSEEKSGWIFENEKWYCYTDGVPDKNRWYYVGEDGAMCMDGWQTIDGQDYFFGVNGAMQTDEEIADILGEENSAIQKLQEAENSTEKTLEQNYTGYFKLEGEQVDEAFINIREIRDGWIYGEYFLTYSYLTETAQFCDSGNIIEIDDKFTIQAFRLYDEIETISDPHTITLKLTQKDGKPALEIIQYDGADVEPCFFLYQEPAHEPTIHKEDPTGVYNFRNGYHKGANGELVYGLDGIVTLEVTKVENNRVYGIFDFMASDDRYYDDFREDGIPINEGTFYIEYFKFQFVHDFMKDEEIYLLLDTGIQWMIPKDMEKSTSESSREIFTKPAAGSATEKFSMSPSRIEEEVLRIRNVWTENREAIANGEFAKEQINSNTIIYSLGEDIRMIEISGNENGLSTKMIQIENGNLTFAYYGTSQGQMRCYFKDNHMFRWVQTDTNGHAVTHDMELENPEFIQHEQQIIQEFQSLLDHYQGAMH